MKKNNKGFTLVELIVVIAVIAVLSAVAIPQYIKYVERSRQGMDASTLNEIKHIVEIEAATIENLNDSTVTITVASNKGNVTAGTDSFTGNVLANVKNAVGTDIAFKSAKSAYAYKLVIDDTGVVTWGPNSATKVAALQAGAATGSEAAES